MGRFSQRRPIVSVQRETTRLVTLVGMLVVLYLLFHAARDPKMWRFLAPADAPATAESGSSSASASTGGAGNGPDRAPAVNPSGRPTGPTDQDPEEWEAIEEEFQAISDRQPMAAIEMASYWRLARWVSAQPAESLARRARRDVLYTHLLEAPEKFRGKPIHLELDARRAVAWDAERNSAGVKRVYETWGVTDESRGRFYCVVFVEPPPGMPIAPSIMEKVRFDGYFHKLIRYEEASGKAAVAPVLIGRLAWAPAPAPPAPSSDWPWLAAALVVGLIGFFGIRTWWGRKPGQADRVAVLQTARATPAEEWLRHLDAAESARDRAPGIDGSIGTESAEIQNGTEGNGENRELPW